MTDQHEIPSRPSTSNPEAAAAQAEALADATERGRWPLRLLELTDVAETAIQRHPGTTPREAGRAP